MGGFGKNKVLFGLMVFFTTVAYYRTMGINVSRFHDNIKKKYLIEVQRLLETPLERVDRFTYRDGTTRYQLCNTRKNTCSEYEFAQHVNGLFVSINQKLKGMKKLKQSIESLLETNPEFVDTFILFGMDVLGATLDGESGTYRISQKKLDSGKKQECRRDNNEECIMNEKDEIYKPVIEVASEVFIEAVENNVNILLTVV